MGDERKNMDEMLDKIVGTLASQLPRYQQALRAEYGPQAAAETAIARRYSPEIAQIQADTLGDQGKQLAGIGRDISRAEQLGAAETERDIVTGPGAETARAGLALEKEVDPEYFASRSSLLSDLTKAFASLGDPNQLAPTEQEGIARGLGRTAWNVRSPMQTISNAMTFGDRQAQRRAELNNLINTRAAALQPMRSGISGYGMATNRTILPNVGTQNYTGIQTPGLNQVNQSAQMLTGQSTALAQQEMQKRKSWLDNYLGITEGIANIGSSVGGFTSLGMGR